MTKPLQPIYLCDKCHHRGEINDTWHYDRNQSNPGAQCDGTLIPHYSLPDLESYLNGLIHHLKTQETQEWGKGYHFAILVFQRDLKEAK